MSQSASSVILIRPTGFGYDPETAASNEFQQRVPVDDARRSAAEEFDALIEALRQSGIGCTVLDPIDPKAPNAVFPNNWFSTHDDGTLVLYPMLTPSRRAERDPDLARVLEVEGFAVRQTLDFSGWEHHGLILEGTGSLVLDRIKRRAFACLSPRTTERALDAWCEQLGFTPIGFTATMDGRLNGAPIYHTNVVMSIGAKWGLVCFDAMPYPADRQEVEEELAKSGREVIAFDLPQLHRFVGNALELSPKRLSGIAGHHERGEAIPKSPLMPQSEVIFLSETAFHALKPFQRIALERHARLIPVAVPTIEAIGGGSVRCMMAENFLSRV
ncbi:MAG TPA: arginine deiminase-related protein [Flavobacteriales bacterium]|nr:arginine deiminase-related protein [Flavobacteriales bacterium]